MITLTGRLPPGLLWVGCSALAILTCAASCTGVSETRVALIGLDGASWHVMTPLMARGELPALSRLVESGTSGYLRTLPGIKLVSPAIWTTVATGKLPEKHGIRDYLQRPPRGGGRRGLVDRTMRRTEALWTILSAYDLDVTVVGWWATWPAEPVNGFLVSDRYPHTRWEEWHDAEQSAAVVYPPSLEPELLRLLRNPQDFRPEEMASLLPMTPEVVQRLHEDAWTRYDPFIELKHAFLEQESYVTAARHLARLRRPRFFALYLSLVDVAEHFFWHNLEPWHFPSWAEDPALAPVIHNAYRDADRIIAEFIERLGHDYDYLVVSDHSMLPTGRIPLSGSHYRDRVLPSPEGYAEEELSLDGVIIAQGPHIRQGTIHGASIADVTPTILYMLGVPTGSDMDGVPLTELLVPSLLERSPVDVVPTHDMGKMHQVPPFPPPGDQEVKRKLKALGYTD